MEASDVLSRLEAFGSASYRRILANHGAKEPLFGVKISELKKIQKVVKRDYQLALDLFESGNYDAQYLAGLIADDAKMTKRDLKRWLAKSNCLAISGTSVAWVTAESRYGAELAREWIESADEATAHAGWTALAALVSIKQDADLDLPDLKRLLKRVERTIHDQPNMVRYAMNGFVISIGSYVASLTDDAIAAGEKIGAVEVDMGPTACEVPLAADYLRKVQARGTIGKKRKTAKC
jgi:3-methyladenine DNA glycosylase AlkD